MLLPSLATVSMDTLPATSGRPTLTNTETQQRNIPRVIQRSKPCKPAAQNQDPGLWLPAEPLPVPALTSWDRVPADDVTALLTWHVTG